MANKPSEGANSRLRIIALGYIVRGPIGGMAWHHLQYVMGLARLGHDVYFLEDSDDYPSCYDPHRNVTDVDPTYGLGFASESFADVGLADRWAYYDAHSSRWYGMGREKALAACATADLVLNLSGVNPLRPWLQEIPVRAFIDHDPAFTQVQHLTGPVALAAARNHNAFFSFGENFGCSECSIPDDGLPWQPTRQPVVLDAWSVVPGPPQGRFTTVMQWDSYPALQYGGRSYGVKSDSFGSFIDLPDMSGRVFELALGTPTAPRALLTDKGWMLRDPLAITRDLWTYRKYIQHSKAEFSVAKHGYVATRSGWFSERSAAYLASGRPVLVQDTAFSRWMETGRGVIGFSTPEEAVEGVREINGRYEFHCRAAREIAEAYFDSRNVLAGLIERAMESATKTG